MATATRTSKRPIGLERVNKNSARFCTFLRHHCTTTTSKCLIQRYVLWKTQIGDDEFFVLFLSLSAVATKSISGKFTYISHCQRTGISATKIEKKHQFSLNVTFSLLSPSSMLKLPIITLLRKTND